MSVSEVTVGQAGAEGTSRQAEEQYLQRVVAAIEGQAGKLGGALPGAKSTLNRIPDRDFSAQAAAAGAVNRAEDRIITLRELRDRPYFGRIDFHDQQWDELLKVYVGLAQLDDESESDFLVYDWRTDIADLFYEGRVGAASYTAPMGEISGQILRRREYVIEQSRLKSIYETGTAAADVDRPEVTGSTDELLQSLLDRSATGAMRQIVQSIQAEQNTVVRSDGEVLAVQGPAGSGKTVVALHRAAYLLYHLRQKKGAAAVSAKRMVVFSPSEVFSEYISRVLPDLQEDQIRRVVLERGCVQRLQQELRTGEDGKKRPAFQISTKHQHHELLLRAGADSSLEHRLIGSRIKSSAAMLELIERFMEQLEKQAEDALDDIRTSKVSTSPGTAGQPSHVETTVFIRRENLLGALQKNQRQAGLLERMRSVIRLIDTQVRSHESHAWTDRGPANELRAQRARLQNWIDAHLARPLDDFYRNLWQQSELAAEILPKGWEAAAEYTLTMLGQQHVPYEDVVPMLLLSGFLSGFPSMGEVDHAIIDEAQDYSIVDYAYLTRCLPSGCTYTIVGDVNQATSPAQSFRSFEELRTIFRARLKCLELTRGYRSSQEITEFARHLLAGDIQVESVRSSGRRPHLTLAAKLPAWVLVLEPVKQLQALGHNLIAIICKTTAEAEALHRELPRDLRATLLCEDSTTLGQGIFVLPAYLAKGLEFDAVVIPDISQDAYARPAERNLLYTVCTRALHDLHLISPGELTPLVTRTDLADVLDLRPAEPEAAPAVDDDDVEPAADEASSALVEATLALEAQALEAHAAAEHNPLVEQSVEELSSIAAMVAASPDASAPDESTTPAEPTPALETAPHGGVRSVAPPAIVLSLPTADGGVVEIRFTRKIAKKEFERIVMMLELSEPAFVNEE